MLCSRSQSTRVPKRGSKASSVPSHKAPQREAGERCHVYWEWEAWTRVDQQCWRQKLLGLNTSLQTRFSFKKINFSNGHYSKKIFFSFLFWNNARFTWSCRTVYKVGPCVFHRFPNGNIVRAHCTVTQPGKCHWWVHWAHSECTSSHAPAYMRT